MRELNNMDEKSFKDLKLEHYVDEKDRVFFSTLPSFNKSDTKLFAVFQISMLPMILLMLFAPPAYTLVFLVIWMAVLWFHFGKLFRFQKLDKDAKTAFRHAVENRYGLEKIHNLEVGNITTFVHDTKAKFAYLTLADDNITPLLIDADGNELPVAVGHESKPNEANVVDESFTEVFVK